MYHIFTIYSLVEEHLGFLYFVAIVTKASVNMG